MNMGNNQILRRAVRLALVSGGTVAGLMTHSSPAQAQAAPAAAGETAAPLEEVVVTGSRITSPALEAISPITALSAQDIKESGVTRVEDLVNSLPQVVADQGSGLSMGSNGIATVNLRGLGPQRTLVLVNGKRLIGGDPTGGGASVVNLGYASAADVNQIPIALVERIDVLTGGASSTYGADAVAGVVNFIMNDHFEGVRLDATAGIYNHENHQGWINPLLTARKFPTVTGTNWDGNNKALTLIMGHNFAEGKGNLEGYLGYSRNAPITADRRDHAACVLQDFSTTSFVPFHCGGSSNSAPAVIYNQTTFSSVQVSAAGTLVPKYQRFNYAASHYLQRIDERYTAGFFGKYKFNEHVEAYTEFMFMDDATRGNYAPAGIFLASGFATNPPGVPGAGLRNGDWLVNCGTTGVYGNPGMNPYLTANEFATLCSPGSKYGIYPNAAGDVQLLLARRNVEGGPRQDEYTHTTWRGVFGARGEISSDWTYDASFTYSYVRTTDFHNNDTSSTRMQNALLAVPGPGGTIVCRGGQSGCVPWNIWNPAIPITPAQISYFSAPGELQGYGSEQIFTAFVSGDLTNAGIKLPTTTEGVKLVLGTEYRQEADTFRPDEELITADLAGNGSPIIGYSAGYHVWEGFTELGVPLVRNVTGLKSLDFEAGYRYSSYTSGFDTNTYKFGITWQPINDVRLRASYNQAVRTPNVAELFKPQYVGLDSGGDVCATTTYTAAQCALTNGGVPLPVYPAPSSPAGQFNGLIGGNTLLKPETGKTKNVGLVLTPSFVPRLSVTIDYTDIKLSDIITSYGPNLIQANCIATGLPFWCAPNPPLGQPGVHRDPGGTLWASPQGYTIDPLLNLNQLENESIDVGIAYAASMGKAGGLRFRFDGTYLLKLQITPGGGKPYDCAGFYGPDCSPGTPKQRFRLQGDWDTPLTGASFGATWRYYGPVDNTLLNPGFPEYVGAAVIAVNGPPPDARLPSISYLDLRASYVWNKVTVRVGCNNVLDKDPPLFDTVSSGGNQAFAESNTFPSMYDVAGRFLYIQLTADF